MQLLQRLIDFAHLVRQHDGDAKILQRFLLAIWQRDGQRARLYAFSADEILHHGGQGLWPSAPWDLQR